MPLPCSPVSNSTASESQSFPATSEDESDASLTTPRPGPVDPSQRTAENLSRPSIPASSTSPSSIAKDLGPSTSDSTLIQQADSTAHGFSGPSSLPSVTGAAVLPERQRSITFLRQIPSPKRRSVYGGSGQSSMSRLSPAASPGGGTRVPLEEPEAESSADENTAIFRREQAAGRQYGAVLASESQADAVQEGSTTRKRLKSKTAQSNSEEHEDGQEDLKESWWKRTLAEYGSVELENKGSVARDHLALERTFLAWLRTSLSFASIGIAVTQLFRLNTSLESDDGTQSDPAANLRQVGKPLGATFLGISILILLLGFHRYFESQHYVIRGKFPASRGTIVLVSFVAGGLIVASLAVVLAIAPSAFET